MDEVRIGTDTLSVVVARYGAELQSLRWHAGGDDTEGVELLWQAGPEWRRRAPTLFPVVGRVADDEVVVNGRRYPMGQHGFARDLDFETLEATPTRVTMRLVDDATTRERYPFPFALVVTHEVEGSSLTVRWAVHATGDEPLPFSVGWHPAFRWPLADGVAKDEHTVVFAEPEPAPARGVRGGLLVEPHPSPVDGRTLHLSVGLFADDAVVLDELRSRSFVYAGPGTPQVRMTTDGFPQLGVWSTAGGADFVCLEPWSGLASPEGWQGELRDKPLGTVCPPGEVREVSCTVSVGPPA